MSLNKPKTAWQTATERITVRLTPEDKAIWERLASEKRMNMTQYLRMLIHRKKR